MHPASGREPSSPTDWTPLRIGCLLLLARARLYHRCPQLSIASQAWRDHPISWDQDVLSFIEVKSRTTRDVKPPEARLIMPSNPSSRQWLGTTCAVFHQRASGASTLSAYIMRSDKPAGRSS